MKELKKVLLVDDEEELITTLVERLEIRGLEAVGLQTGQEAMALVKKVDDFDVVVLDVKLKGEDGVELMRKIKQIRPHLPVILLTGHMSKETSEEGVKAGAIDYIIKPISIENLIERLRKAMALYPATGPSL
jgi:DNA-binding NtrC family response regulator